MHIYAILVSNFIISTKHYLTPEKKYSEKKRYFSESFTKLKLVEITKALKKSDLFSRFSGGI